jgi:hypothetical protein
MEEKSVFSIPVYGKIQSEYLVIVGNKIESHSCGKLPGIDHGIGRMRKYIVHIAGIGKYIKI